MVRTKRGRKLLLIIFLSMVAMTLSGCVYVDNKSWDEMTSKEQEEVRQVFAEERKELEEEFSDDSPDGRFVQYILDHVEWAMDHED